MPWSYTPTDQCARSRPAERLSGTLRRESRSIPFLSWARGPVVSHRFGVSLQDALQEGKRTAEAQRDSDELLRVAFETSPNAITIARRGDARSSR